MKLIPNWKNAVKMYSVRAMAAAASLQAAWLTMPDDIKATLPSSTPKVLGFSLIVLMIVGIFGRLISQEIEQ
mgnify:CR=1 FL=1|tara:strand:+ start:4103 stop:4318 length:216 start_codon:yes stop_codon:yes gene_type:complete